MTLPKRILIVEDEAIVAKDLEFRLKDLGYDVVGIVSTGARAIEVAASQNPDLILMDIHLKGDMDGIETTARITQSRPVPVVYLTAFADQGTFQRAKVTDPFGYVLKPFDERSLQINIEVAFHKFMGEQQIIRREKWIESVLNNINSAVIATDATGVINYINPSAELILGAKASVYLDTLFTDVIQFLNESNVQFTHHPVEVTLRRGTPQIFDKIVLSCASTSPVWVYLSVSRLSDSHGQPMGVVVGLNDISSTIEVARTLRSTQQTMDEKLDESSKTIRRQLDNALMRIKRLEAQLKEQRALTRKAERTTASAGLRDPQ